MLNRNNHTLCYTLKFYMSTKELSYIKAHRFTYLRKRKFWLDALRKKWRRFFNGKNNIEVWSRLEIAFTTLCSIHRSLCTPYHPTTAWLIIPANIYGRYIVTRVRIHRTNTIRYSVNGGFTVQFTYRVYPADICQQFVAAPWSRGYTYPEIEGEINPCNVEIKITRSTNVWTTVSIASPLKLQSSFEATLHVPPLKS